MKQLLLIFFVSFCTACATTTPAPITNLEQLLPATPPTGFSTADAPVLRDRNSIFEQINGGSVSYLENGMVDALFTTE